MTVEVAQFINNLNPALPTGASDPITEGDNHIRLIKGAILATFPAIAGQVTATHADLSSLLGAATTGANGLNVVTQAATNNGTLAASTAQVQGAIGVAIAPLAPLASPVLVGTPTAPTATPGTNTGQLATTAFAAALNIVGTAAATASATASASTATSAAASAAISAGAVIWVTGSTYAVNARVISPSNGRVYMSLAAGVSNTDPASDTRWLLVTTNRVAVVITAATATAVSGTHYVMTNAAQSILTLPASPVTGSVVQVTFTNTRTDNVIARNGSALLLDSAGNPLLEDMTVDVLNRSVILEYAFNTWRFYLDSTAVASSAVVATVTQATDAAATATTAATAATTARTAIDNKYRGALAADPATRPDSTANQVGDEYFSTIANLLKRFDGSTWQASDINTANLAASTGAGLVGYGSAAIDNILKNSVGKVVTSIAALKAIDKTRYTQTFATGYYASGDGGGGAYWYDSTDTTATDNGGTVIVATDGGRWKLLVNTQVTAKQFGAKGDGNTNDSPAIQSAVTWCVANNKSLYITRSSGLYLLNNSISITGQISISGDSQFNSGLVCIAAEGFVISAGVIGVQIEKLSIALAVRYSATPNTFKAIRVNGTSGSRPDNHTYRDLFIDGFETAILSIWQSNLVIDNVKTYFGKVGIEVQGDGVNDVVTSSQFSVAGTGSRGIWFSDSTNATEGWMISGNLLYGAEIGLHAVYTSNCHFTNNIVDFCLNNGIKLESGVGASTNWVIRDNYIAINGAGGSAGIGLANTVTGSRFTGSVISGNDILAYAGSICNYGIIQNGPNETNNIITENHFTNIAVHDVRINAGVVDTTIVKGNVFPVGVFCDIRSNVEGNVGPNLSGALLTYQVIANNKKQTFSTSAPATGTWSLGDRSVNFGPVVGSPKAWVCTVAGAPGTWVSEGNL